MAKQPKTRFVCRECGNTHLKWQGKCDGCGAWNTLVEEVEATTTAPAWQSEASGIQRKTGAPQRIQEITAEAEERLQLPDPELTRVLSGGLVGGSLTLLGGEPGIGKSTLLLQLALSMQGQSVLYVTGEESPRQVKLRAERFGSVNPELRLLAETEVETLLKAAARERPMLLIVDSIQTLFTEQASSAPGSVAQVRESTARLLRFAKETGVAVWLVGHINKEGMIAGPKVLEHMVDTVLEFEGDRHYNFRLLRAVKNRFGATPELGIYEMRANGLRPVANPSELFLSGEVTAEQGGVAVAPTLQGVRPILTEVQALVATATYGTPQRSATGFDRNRLNMLLAVLEKKCGLKTANKDVFLNLTGGLRLQDPALDLAAAVAMLSSAYDAPVPVRTAFAGEIGLTGEVRPVSKLELRVTETAKLGFERLYVSGQGSGDLTNAEGHLRIIACDDLQTVFSDLFG